MDPTSKTCKKCHQKRLIRDEITNNLVCESCGVEHEFDNFQPHFNISEGPQGTFIRVGSSSHNGDFNYKETKLYYSKLKIQEISKWLDFTPTRTNEVTRMIEEITDGDFGSGNWFSVLVGACCYVIMRKDNNLSSLSMSEVAVVIGCELHELGRMVVRVTGYLELELPEFDIVLSFERAIMVCHSFENVLKGDMVGKMIKQGRFLLNCAVKWFLTTGRQPVPVVVAVLIFVSELNGVEVSFDEVAKEMRAGVFTCRKRYKEIKEALVKVAQSLPWGKNVTDENIVKNAPGIIQYMEIKSRLERGDKRKFIEMHEFHMEEIINECLRKETGFDFDDLSAENDSQYFEGETQNRISGNASSNDMDYAKISQECLSNMYRNFLSENHYVKSVDEEEKDYRKKRKKEAGIQVYKDWWSGMSDMSQKLFLEEILEKDVGFNGLPPSFVAGELAFKRRREKINAAKQRIDEIVQPPNSVTGDKKNMALVEGSQCRKQRKQREKVGYIDWEDCIIETLLLYHVKEEEIEQGHYKRMLDLYVFDSERTCKIFGRKKMNSIIDQKKKKNMSIVSNGFK